MIEQTKTYERLINAIEQGAQLRFLHGSDFEGTIYTLKAWIVKGENRVQIPMSIANRIAKHPDIREGYPGYISDYAHRWESMYEHVNALQPRWVTEQWGWD